MNFFKMIFIKTFTSYFRRMKLKKKFIATGAILGGLGVILGAFGAHALKHLLDLDSLTSFNTGVRYQMYHSFFLIIAGLASDKIKESLAKIIYWFCLLGVICFSLSIYLLNLGPAMGVDMSFLGPITPLGGLMLITAWFTLAIAMINKPD